VNKVPKNNTAVLAAMFVIVGGMVFLVQAITEQTLAQNKRTSESATGVEDAYASATCGHISNASTCTLTYLPPPEISQGDRFTLHPESGTNPHWIVVGTGNIWARVYFQVGETSNKVAFYLSNPAIGANNCKTTVILGIGDVAPWPSPPGCTHGDGDSTHYIFKVHSNKQ
jgi:hypothetical protein